MATTPKRLFIPGKHDPSAHKLYSTDMQIIERFNPINRLIAGSGVTLSPSNGTGPEVTVSAPSSSGTSVGYLQVIAGPDDNLNPSLVFFMGSGNIFGQRFLADGQSSIPLFSNNSGSDKFVSWGSGWVANVPGAAGGGTGWSGSAICILPTFTAPTFTGPSIEISCAMGAADVNGSPGAWSQFRNMIDTSSTAFLSGASFQFPVTNFSSGFAIGADLIVVSASGNTGNGICNNGVPTLALWGGINVTVRIPTGVTFT